MHRRHFLHLTIAAAVAAGMSGCSRRDPLRTGIHPWIGYEPLYLAEEFGWLPETIFDLLVVTDAAVSRQRGAVGDLVKAHFLGLQHLVRNTHDAVYRVATRQQVSPEMVRQSLATVMLPELSANHRYLTHNGRLEVVAKMLASIMAREGLIDAPLHYEHLTDPAFLPRSLP